MIGRIFRKYVVDALGHMALGLFCSLILGLIIGQIARIPGLDFLVFISDALDRSFVRSVTTIPARSRNTLRLRRDTIR